MSTGMHLHNCGTFLCKNIYILHYLILRSCVIFLLFDVCGVCQVVVDVEAVVRDYLSTASSAATAAKDLPPKYEEVADMPPQYDPQTMGGAAQPPASPARQP
jgi:hypothetical protein